MNGLRVAMREPGREPWDELTSVGDVKAISGIALQFGVPIGTTVLQRKRVHGITGKRAPECR